MQTANLPAASQSVSCGAGGRPEEVPPLSGRTSKDLLNPEFEPIEMGKNIPDVKMMTISPGSVTGHASAGGGMPADVEFLNREVGAFLDAVTEGGKKLN